MIPNLNNGGEHFVIRCCKAVCCQHGSYSDPSRLVIHTMVLDIFIECIKHLIGVWIMDLRSKLDDSNKRTTNFKIDMDKNHIAGRPDIVCYSCFLDISRYSSVVRMPLRTWPSSLF